jgi:hypothetical protein
MGPKSGSTTDKPLVQNIDIKFLETEFDLDVPFDSSVASFYFQHQKSILQAVSSKGIELCHVQDWH